MGMSRSLKVVHCQPSLPTIITLWCSIETTSVYYHLLKWICHAELPCWNGTSEILIPISQYSVSDKKKWNLAYGPCTPAMASRPHPYQLLIPWTEPYGNPCRGPMVTTTGIST